MKYIMGVDGGGSKTLTVICNEHGKKIGQGMAGCGNHQVKGINHAIINIKESIRQAINEANLNYSDISFTLFGLAGADREKDLSILRPALSKLPFENWEIQCDTMEGLRTGSPDNIGVILVCGSGTNAAGRNEKGETVQTGGFGYFYGDGPGVGGNALAKETFRMAVRSWEYREECSILPHLVAKYLGYTNIEEAYHDFLDKNIKSVPRDLSLVLHTAAKEGDKLAISLLERAGIELGIAANSVIRRLGGIKADPLPIILVGSVIQKGKNRFLLQKLIETIKKEYTNIEIIIPEMEPVYGAILLGMDRLGIPTGKQMMEKFCNHDRHELNINKQKKIK